MQTGAGCWCRPNAVFFVMCNSASLFRFSKHEWSYVMCERSVGTKVHRVCV
jgi:hypothetical protein